jgi:hypothetical protein
MSPNFRVDLWIEKVAAALTVRTVPATYTRTAIEKILPPL